MNDPKLAPQFKMIWRFARPFRAAFLNLFLCVIITSFIGMLYPYIFGMLVDEVFYHRNVEFFKIIIIGYGITFLGEQLLHLILNSTWAYLMTRFLFDIRKKVFDHSLFLKAAYLNQVQTGDLVARINKDSEEFMNFIHWNVFYLLANICRLLMAVALVAVLNLKIAAIMLAVIPVTVYISRYFAKKVKVQYQKYRDSYGNHISWVFEILGGIREIRLLAGERNVIRKFIKNCSNLIWVKIKSSWIEFGSERTNSLISLLSSLILYGAAGIFIVRGELTVGGFIAIIDYFARSAKLLSGLNDASIKIQNNMVSIDKVAKMLSEDAEQPKGKSQAAGALIIPEGKIEFEELRFGYHEHHQVLRGVNLAIHAGEKLSIVGKSGAGKSTIVNLLLRFYDPEHGVIKIDGMKIGDCSLKSLRRNIGIVQQDTLLFDGTIRYNLKLGNPKSGERELWEACEKAHAAEFIRNLPQGLDTVIGADGMNLSGGQRQRIAIARIFLKNPKILVFDEATSSLDFEAEQIIQNSWRDLGEGRTMIIIAHNLSTILNSDRVAILHEGAIAGVDHHLKLLENCGPYRDLFQQQYLGAEEAGG